MRALSPATRSNQVRLDKPLRPHPVIWTVERVEAWRRDSIRPPVAVWTLRQLVTFLTGVENDRLAALWWLIALRGLRRGEAAALDRDDLDSESRELTISRQLVALPGELYCGPPKSRASIRTIALDEAGTRRLAGQAVQQTLELLQHQFTEQHRTDSRNRTGPGWRQGRPMFTYADGRPIRPEYLSHRFRTLVKELDLPPIRLHDLRHGAATLAQMSGVASSASFGSFGERALPGPQRVALRRSQRDGTRFSARDLGRQQQVASGAWMRHLIRLQQVTICCSQGNVQERSEGRSSKCPVAG